MVFGVIARQFVWETSTATSARPFCSPSSPTGGRVRRNRTPRYCREDAPSKYDTWARGGSDSHDRRENIDLTNGRPNLAS